MSATLELFPSLKKPLKAQHPAQTRSTTGSLGSSRAGAAAVSRAAQAALATQPTPLQGPAMKEAITRAANYISAKTAGEGPVLTGRYEVIIPDRNGRIAFCETLAEAAELVSSARWSDPAKADDVLAFLEGVQRHGGLSVGEYGVRIHKPYDDGTQWIAKVRGTQHRPLPKYGIGDTVLLAETASPPIADRQVTIESIRVLNDSRRGKQYLYFVKARSTYQVKEGDLLPLTEITGSLDFDQLSA